MRASILVLVVALGACTGSRTLIGDEADPALTSNVPGLGSPEAAAPPDDGMGFLDDVVPEGDGVAGEDEGEGGTDGPPVFTDEPAQDPSNPFADFFGGAAGGGGDTGFFGGDQGGAPAGGNTGTFGGDQGTGDGEDSNADSGEEGSDDAPASDPFTDLISFFLELLAAFFGGG